MVTKTIKMTINIRCRFIIVDFEKISLLIVTLFIYLFKYRLVTNIAYLIFYA